MFSITNGKVAGFAPIWAEFHGFSILFDSSDSCLRERGGLLDLACDVDGDPELNFYRVLRDTVNKLNPDLLTNTYGFCQLPPPSYHVTVWDGCNEGNVEKVFAEDKTGAKEYLSQISTAVQQPHRLTQLPLASPLVLKRDWNLEFQFCDVAIWSYGMFARLVPTPAAEAAFEALDAERRRLNSSYRMKFGIGASERLTPHVSLGYFANREGAQLATACLPAWNALFSQKLQGLTLSFSHASLYAFTDMATFFTTNNDNQ